MPPDLPMTEGTVKVMFKNIQKDLDEIKRNYREDQKALHDRVNGVERCINEEVKPRVSTNKADIEWVKHGFWFVAGVGSSSLLLVIGVIISSWIGG